MSFWFSLLVGYLAWSSLYLVGCLLLVRLLRSVVLVITGYCEFYVEGTPFGVLLVIVATVTTRCAGFRWLEGISYCMSSFWHAACYCCACYNWLCWFSLAVGDFLMSVFFLANCLLLLRLLRWVVLVSGSYVVFYACFVCFVCFFFFALKSFHWGPVCLWSFIVTF